MKPETFFRMADLDGSLWIRHDAVCLGGLEPPGNVLGLQLCCSRQQHHALSILSVLSIWIQSDPHHFGGSGSGRIRIILVDPDRHPGPADPDPYPFSNQM